jgi:hypothetical protein
MSASPCAPLLQDGHGRFGNAELRRQIALAFAGRQALANGDDVGIGQLCRSIPGSMRRSVALCGVAHVVRMCPDLKMFGIDATAVVASVANHEIGWEAAIVNGIRYSVGLVQPAANVEQPVATIAVGQPLPAFIRAAFFNLGPEPAQLSLGAKHSGPHPLTIELVWRNYARLAQHLLANDGFEVADVYDGAKATGLIASIPDHALAVTVLCFGKDKRSASHMFFEPHNRVDGIDAQNVASPAPAWIWVDVHTHNLLPDAEHLPMPHDERLPNVVVAAEPIDRPPDLVAHVLQALLSFGQRGLGGLGGWDVGPDGDHAADSFTGTLQRIFAERLHGMRIRQQGGRLVDGEGRVETEHPSLVIGGLPHPSGIGLVVAQLAATLDAGAEWLALGPLSATLAHQMSPCVEALAVLTAPSP